VRYPSVFNEPVYQQHGSIFYQVRAIHQNHAGLSLPCGLDLLDAGLKSRLDFLPEWARGGAWINEHPLDKAEAIALR
jgi:hypothetical protein